MINNESSELISTYIAAPFGNYIHTNNTKSVRGSFTLYKRKGLIKQILKTLRFFAKHSNLYRFQKLIMKEIHMTNLLILKLATDNDMLIWLLIRM